MDKDLMTLFMFSCAVMVIGVIEVLFSNKPPRLK